jgi:hypothetical protein
MLVHAITASFGELDGWIEPPSRNRREPWIGGAMLFVNGSTVSSMPNRAAAISGHAHRRHRSASSLAATMNTSVPAPIPVSWRSR